MLHMANFAYTELPGLINSVQTPVDEVIYLFCEFLTSA